MEFDLHVNDDAERDTKRMVEHSQASERWSQDAFVKYWTPASALSLLVTALSTAYGFDVAPVVVNLVTSTVFVLLRLWFQSCGTKYGCFSGFFVMLTVLFQLVAACWTLGVVHTCQECTDLLRGLLYLAAGAQLLAPMLWCCAMRRKV